MTHDTRNGWKRDFMQKFYFSVMQKDQDKLIDFINHQLQKAREDERERIAQMLSKAGTNKISVLDDGNFTGTYWISLNNTYHILTGRQINDDFEKGKVEKNPTLEMIVRNSVYPVRTKDHDTSNK